MLKDPFQRGRIEAFVRRSATGSRVLVTADIGLANEYERVINQVAEDLVGFVSRDVPFTFVLGQPGVLTISEGEVDVMTEWDVVEIALQSAIDDLLEMRTVEGRALEADLLQNLEQLKTLVSDVAAVSMGINERLKQRLEGRIRRMVGDRFDPYRIAQEVAVLADKADVSEELARLRSHCEQFEDALSKEEPVGRRLEFLLQEMNREVNTVGSKAAEHPVTQLVVDMKATLERMREQAANVQ